MFVIQTAYDLVKVNPKGTGGWSLLHIASSQNSSVGRFSMKIFPSPKVSDIKMSAFLLDIDANGEWLHSIIV